MGCVEVDYAGWVSYLLGSNIFWSIFEKRDVPKDGHCFIHALILSLSTLSLDLPCLTYDLRHEKWLFIGVYKPKVYIMTVSLKVSEMYSGRPKVPIAQHFSSETSI